MAPSVRKSEAPRQRIPDTAIRNNMKMPRPPHLPTTLITIGQRVRWWRNYRKLKQSELAKAVGISPSTLSDLESDRQGGSGKLHLIAAKLGLNAHYIETGRGEPESEFTQEPPAEVPSWPFHAIPQGKLSRLNKIELSYIENKVQEALAEIEQERRKAHHKTG